MMLPSKCHPMPKTRRPKQFNCTFHIEFNFFSFHLKVQRDCCRESVENVSFPKRSSKGDMENSKLQIIGWTKTEQENVPPQSLTFLTCIGTNSNENNPKKLPTLFFRNCSQASSSKALFREKHAFWANTSKLRQEALHKSTCLKPETAAWQTLSCDRHPAPWQTERGSKTSFFLVQKAVCSASDRRSGLTPTRCMPSAFAQLGQL